MGPGGVPGHPHLATDHSGDPPQQRGHPQMWPTRQRWVRAAWSSELTGHAPPTVGLVVRPCPQPDPRSQRRGWIPTWDSTCPSCRSQGPCPPTPHTAGAARLTEWPHLPRAEVPLPTNPQNAVPRNSRQGADVPTMVRTVGGTGVPRWDVLGNGHRFSNDSKPRTHLGLM